MRVMQAFDWCLCFDFVVRKSDHQNPIDKNKKLTIGFWVAVIYEALRDGRLHEPLMEILVEAEALTAATRVGLFNGWVGFNGEVEVIEISHDKQREVAIVDGKRRRPLRL